MMRITLCNYRNDKLYPKVVGAVARLLARQNEITVVDVMLEMGHLVPRDYYAWQDGKVACLERVFQGSLAEFYPG